MRRFDRHEYPYILVVTNMDMMEKEVRPIGQYFNMKIVFSFIGGIIIGILFAVPLVERDILRTSFLAKFFETEEQEMTPDAKVPVAQNKLPPRDIAAGAAAPQGGSLVVVDQTAGLSVGMSMVSLSQDGWIAIHEKTEDGDMGNILGARRFLEGKYFGSVIDLLRGTESGKTYYAVLHIDDGDSIFDFETEVPARDSSGALIAAQFTAVYSGEASY